MLHHGTLSHDSIPLSPRPRGLAPPEEELHAPHPDPLRPHRAEMNDIDGTDGLVMAVGPRGRIEACTDGLSFRRLSAGVSSSELCGVWVAAPDLAYVVGSHGVALRWDGRRMTRIPTGTHHSLFCVWGPRPDPKGRAGAREDVWIGGADVLLHLTPAGPVRHDITHWVTRIWGAGPDDVWLLGPQRRCLRWDGKGLSASFIAAAEEHDRDSNLYDISGRGAEDVWVVGTEGCILRYTGRRWVRVESMTSAVLYGVCHTATGEVFVITGSGQLRRLLPDGKWTVAADISGLGGSLNGVCAVGDTVWCCGQHGIIRHRFARTEEAL